MTNEVTVEDVDGIRILTINRPERRNALNSAAYYALAEGVAGIDENPELHAVIITGAGDHFCAGNDLADFVAPKQERESADAEKKSGAAALFDALDTVRGPVFAAIEGYAVGIGVTMLLHCDVVYAGSTAKFRVPFAPLGVAPEGGSSLLMQQAGGIKKAKEILMFGEIFTPEYAERAGIITGVVDAGGALAHAIERAKYLATLPQDAVHTAKRLIDSHNTEAIAGLLPVEFAEFGRLLQSEQTQAHLKSMMATR